MSKVQEDTSKKARKAARRLIPRFVPKRVLDIYREEVEYCKKFGKYRTNPDVIRALFKFCLIYGHEATAKNGIAKNGHALHPLYSTEKIDIKEVENNLENLGLGLSVSEASELTQKYYLISRGQIKLSSRNLNNGIREFRKAGVKEAVLSYGIIESCSTYSSGHYSTGYVIDSQEVWVRLSDEEMQSFSRLAEYGESALTSYYLSKKRRSHKYREENEEDDIIGLDGDASEEGKEYEICADEILAPYKEALLKSTEKLNKWRFTLVNNGKTEDWEDVQQEIRICRKTGRRITGYNNIEKKYRKLESNGIPLEETDMPSAHPGMLLHTMRKVDEKEAGVFAKSFEDDLFWANTIKGIYYMILSEAWEGRNRKWDSVSRFSKRFVKIYECIDWENENFQNDKNFKLLKNEFYKPTFCRWVYGTPKYVNKKIGNHNLSCDIIRKEPKISEGELETIILLRSYFLLNFPNFCQFMYLWKTNIDYRDPVALFFGIESISMALVVDTDFADIAVRGQIHDCLLTLPGYKDEIMRMMKIAFAKTSSEQSEIKIEKLVRSGIISLSLLNSSFGESLKLKMRNERKLSCSALCPVLENVKGEIEKSKALMLNASKFFPWLVSDHTLSETKVERSYSLLSDLSISLVSNSAQLFNPLLMCIVFEFVKTRLFLAPVFVENYDET